MSTPEKELDLQRQLLWLTEKPWAKTVSHIPFFNRLLSNKLILILGTQRSGTTLLFLMLTAHDRITGLDENYADFTYPSWPVFATNGLRGKRTLYKLPTVTSKFKEIAKLLPKCKIIWIVRNPLAVVSSMRNLKFDDGQNWIEKHGRSELRETLSVFPEEQLDVDTLDDAAIGAHIWRLKNSLVDKYREQGLEVKCVRYEDLLDRSEENLREILSFLSIEWSPRVIEHEKHHGTERHAGNTSAKRPLDQSRRAPKLSLTDGEQNAVMSICSQVSKRFGIEV